MHRRPKPVPKVPLPEEIASDRNRCGKADKRSSPVRTWAGAGILSLAILSTTCLLLSLVPRTSAHAVDERGTPPYTRDDLGAHLTGSVTSPCTLLAEKEVTPNVALMGDPITVANRVYAVCPPVMMHWQYVFVLDVSAAAAGGPLEAMKHKVVEIVDVLGRYDPTRMWLGIVAYGREARLECPMTRNPADLLTCLQSIEATTIEATDLASGIRVAHAALRDLRLDAPARAMFVVFGAGDMADCSDAAAAASAVRESTLIESACATPACDRACMRAVARSPRNYHELEAFPTESFERVYDIDVIPVRLSSTSIADVLPDGIELVPGSAVPPPVGTSPLRWHMYPVFEITATYSIRATVPGWQPINVSSKGVFTDTRGRTGTWDYEVPWVFVVEPEPARSSKPGSTAYLPLTVRR